MTVELKFLSDLAVVSLFAAVAALLCEYLKQPKVVGYIISGLLIGIIDHYIYDIVGGSTAIRALSDFGVIFLMFYMGLDFNFSKIKTVGLPALLIAVVDVTTAMWIGIGIGLILGWGLIESIFLGAIICDSSTTVLIKILNELSVRGEKYANLVLGATVVEDILAIVIIAMLTGLGVSGTFEVGLVSSRLGLLFIFLTVVIVGGLIVIPKLLDIATSLKSNELIIIIVIGLCFGISLVALKLNFTLALGAFIFGAIVAETKHHSRIGFLTEPFKDVFGAVFFVAIGILVPIREVFGNILPILALTLVVIVGKFIGSTAGALIAGEDARTCIKVGCSMAQVNEFALIIATLGVSLKITPPYIYSIAVMVAVLSTFISPYLIKNSESIFNLFNRFFPVSSKRFIKAYVSWAGKKKVLDFEMDSVRRAVVRSIIIIVVNTAWISAIYLILSYICLVLDKNGIFLLPKEWHVANNTIFWLIGGILTTPLIVASIRKFQALGMITAEYFFMYKNDKPNEIRKILSSSVEWIVMTMGILFIGYSIFFFSKSILPSPFVLLISLGFIFLLIVMLWTHHVKIYSKFQNAFREVFNKDNLPLMVDPLTAWSYLFKDVKLTCVDVLSNSTANSKAIFELDLRNKSGSSIIGIERGGKIITNPSPHEKLSAGDRVILIGTSEQLEEAKKLFMGKMNN